MTVPDRFALAGAVATVVAGLLALGAVGATAADAPKVPEQVSAYFADGLAARLIDLYGPDAGTVADTKAGAITRVQEWTEAFLEGERTQHPTRPTNTWVAPISVGERPLGLAMVWINPSTNLPELADFTPGRSIVAAIAARPTGAVLVRDDAHDAWFALEATVLTPLVPGTSGVRGVTSPERYQDTLASAAGQPAPAPVNQGPLIAAVTLGAVVLLLVGWVLMPERRRPTAPAEAMEPPEPSAGQKP